MTEWEKTLYLTPFSVNPLCLCASVVQGDSRGAAVRWQRELPRRMPPDNPSGHGHVISRTVLILNQRGLHARAAAKFVKLVGQFQAEVTVVKGDMSVAGTSIMGLMMLAAGPGTEIELRAKGRDAFAVIAALAELIGRKFDES